MRTNRKPLRTNPIIFQVVSHSTRLLGVRIVPSRLPITRPAVTAARTPDRPSRSAGRYAANGMTTEIRTSTGGSSRRRRISPETRPTAAPMRIPPTPAMTKPTSEFERMNVPLIAAIAAARYATSAVASLNRASPSISVRMILGVPSLRKTAVAARASVGPTIAPRVNAAAQLSPGTSACATSATTTIVNSTRPMERRTSGTTFARRSRIGDSAAAVKSSGGRNTSRTRSGSSSMRGRPGMKASARPPSTSKVG